MLHFLSMIGAGLCSAIYLTLGIISLPTIVRAAPDAFKKHPTVESLFSILWFPLLLIGVRARAIAQRELDTKMILEDTDKFAPLRDELKMLTENGVVLAEKIAQLDAKDKYGQAWIMINNLAEANKVLTKELGGKLEKATGTKIVAKMFT